MKRMNRMMALGAFAVTTLFLLSGFSGMAGDWSEKTVDLFAGQHTNVGSVNVFDDGDYLIVTFTTIEGWYITETHVDIQTDPDDFPLTKSGNPKVGQFAYSDEYDYVEDVILEIEDIWDGATLYVAAHAVVVEIEEGPHYGGSVYDYEQGLRKDGTAVRSQRSDPEQGLVYEAGQDESNFFSLGFGGWMIIEFDCPVLNRDGNDVKVWEDTWGSYPSETADVYASQYGVNWVYLGEADNSNNVGIHTVSELDLGTLAWAKYIKVVDTSDPSVHNAAADGYDLNAVEALQGCITSAETAWGAGTGFGGSSWAMYFEVESSV